MLDADGVAPEAGGWWEGGLDSVAARKVRVEVPNDIQRPNGTYVVQFMQVQLLEK